EVAVAVIDAAVEADLRAPIAFMPGVFASSEAPIARRPKLSHAGGNNPGARHPIVAIVAVLIIAGCPNIPVTGAGRLVEDRNGRRRDVYRKLDSGEGLQAEENGQQDQIDCE